MLIAYVSVSTITGDHDGYCSGNENEDVKGYLEEIPVQLLEHDTNIFQLCAAEPNYRSWLVEEMDFLFQTCDTGTYGSGYCESSPLGLYHEMVGTVEKVYRLEFAPDSVIRSIEYACNVKWKEEAWRTRPRFICEQLFTLFKCVCRLKLPLCKDMRKEIANKLTNDWNLFVLSGKIDSLI
jgi:hypothetical protein